MSSPAPETPLKRMRLRYVGTCRECSTPLPRGEAAYYDRSTKTVLCLSCQPASETAADRVPSRTGADDSTGKGTPEGTREASVYESPPTDHRGAMNTAGASARREFERRQTKREEAVRAKHPKLGGFLLAISDDPQSTKAWDAGAKGEELLGKRLNKLAEKGVIVMHDRRIPRTRANIDHIAITAKGVWVIDAKRYRDKRPSLKVEGGILRPRIEKLLVGGRDRTTLVDGVIKQRDLVAEALRRVSVEVQVEASLCFIEANWPLFGRSFAVREVLVTWPQKLEDALLADGPLGPDEREHVARVIAEAFPPA